MEKFHDNLGNTAPHLELATKQPHQHQRKVSRGTEKPHVVEGVAEHVKGEGEDDKVVNRTQRQPLKGTCRRQKVGPKASRI